MPFLANIERCPKFLEYALHTLICRNIYLEINRNDMLESWGLGLL